MKHEILTNNGIPVQLIRYFNYQGKDYLIFTKENDIDAQGYVTIHISEVISDNDLSAISVDDNLAKEIVKLITNANKNNMSLNIVDLNYNNIDGINILSDKAFRVLPNYVDILSKNQPIFEKINNVQENLVVTPINSFESDANINFNSDNGINNNPFDVTQFVNEVPMNENLSNENISINNDGQIVESDINENIDNSQFTQAVDNFDYKKLYLEQVELVKSLNVEIEIYKNKIEMLKNIINN